jgi:hypothetical protein
MSAIARNVTIAIIERVNRDEPEVRKPGAKHGIDFPRTSRGMISVRSQRAPTAAAS